MDKKDLNVEDDENLIKVEPSMKFANKAHKIKILDGSSFSLSISINAPRTVATISSNNGSLI